MVSTTVEISFHRKPGVFPIYLLVLSVQSIPSGGYITYPLG